MTTATIVHQNGSTQVQDFERIEEAEDQQTLRVFYEEPGPNRAPMPAEDLFYEEYYYARIVEVDASDDEDGDGGGGFITVDS